MAEEVAHSSQYWADADIKNLDDHDVANVLTYIRNSWGNAAPAVDPDDVESLRVDLQK
jgi:mono/diheme cytochrome c family protein